MLNTDTAFWVVLAVFLVITAIASGVMVFSRYWNMAWGLVVLVVPMVILLALAAGGWEGMTENGCIEGQSCYCEAQDPANKMIAPGKIRQPGNTLTAFAPVVMGLFILWELEYNRVTKRTSPATVKNAMILPNALSIAYACLVVFLGPGSMFFHASLKEQPGLIDPTSIIFYGLFVFCYSLLARLGMKGTPLTLWVGGLHMVAATSVTVAIWTGGIPADIGSGLALMPVLLYETIQFFRDTFGHSRPSRDFLWSGSALCLFGGSVLIWALSQSGEPFCGELWSSSLFQGHGVWHIGAMALAPGAIYRSFQSERDSRNKSPNTSELVFVGFVVVALIVLVVGLLVAFIK